jgi:tetratricopeptide (TPR) repeat protein
MALMMLTACTGAEGRKARYVERGDEFFAAQDFHKARIEYSNALLIDPKNARARYQSGQIAEKLSNPRDAVGHYLAALEVDPSHVAARAALARLYLLGGLADKAMETVEAGLAAAPDDAQLRTVRGAVRLRQGDKSGATEDAEAAVRDAPDNAYALALLSSIYRGNGRLEEAIKLLTASVARAPRDIELRIILADMQLASGRPAEAEAQLQKTVEIEPEDLAHWQRLARFRLRNRDVDGAEQAMRAAVKAMPDSVAAKLSLTELLAAQRGVDRAEQQLLQFVQQEPKSAELKLATGRFFESQRKPDKAEAVYREVIAAEGLRPDGLAARNRLAGLKLQANDTASARQLIDAVLAESPRDNDALVMRGNLALASGDATVAIADLRAALRDQPTAVTVMRALARAHMQNSEATLAEEVLRSAVRSNPQDAAAQLDLAALLAQSGRLDQAQAALEALVEAAPTNLAAWEGLFRAQIGRQDVRGALATAEEVKRQRPNEAVGYYFAGMVKEAEKQPDAARAEYQKALMLQPEVIEPLTALVRLDLAANQSARALELLDAALAQRPNNALARNLKGEVLTSQGRYDAAAAQFTAASSHDPKWWVPYRGLALAHMGAKRPDAAIAALRQGVDKTGGAAALTTDLAALYERLGRTDDAIQMYEDIASRNPKSIMDANRLAMLLVSYRTDQPSLDRAEKLAESLSGSTDPSSIDTRGWVKFKRGAVQEALPLLLQAVEKSPSSAVMRYHLGMAQYRAGDRANAERNLDVALQTGNRFVGLEEARQALSTLRGKG